MKGSSGKTPLGTLMLDKDYGEKYIDNTNCLLSYSSIKVSDPLDDELGTTPIHVFAMRGMVDLLQKWLKFNPTLVNICDKWGHTPLHYAVMQMQHNSLNFNIFPLLLYFLLCALLFDCLFDLQQIRKTMQRFKHSLVSETNALYLFYFIYFIYLFILKTADNGANINAVCFANFTSFHFLAMLPSLGSGSSGQVNSILKVAMQLAGGLSIIDV